MKLQRLEEKELISVLRKEFSASCPELTVGIGDDAAVIKAGKSSFIITKDLLVEDFHFVSSFHPPYFLGRKSLNVNLSDIAAMGGVPRYALLGLGLPIHIELDWLEKFFAGLKSAAKEESVILIGGDISQAKKITISVTAVGEGKNILKRSGAKPGHLLFVSGTLGDARQGLLLARKGYGIGDDKKADTLLKAFLDPAPCVSLGCELSRPMLASSMIDISDGLSVDLGHICKESGCGAEIYLEKLPISTELRSMQRRAFWYALHGGEDYQLLFSIPPQQIDSISRLQKKFRITQIGRIIGGKGVFIVDKSGKRKKLMEKGYHHFKMR